MTRDRISWFRDLIYQVNDNAWKRLTGCGSERREADRSDQALVSKLCGALEEALTELEKTCSS